MFVVIEISERKKTIKVFYQRIITQGIVYSDFWNNEVLIKVNSGQIRRTIKILAGIDNAKVIILQQLQIIKSFKEQFIGTLFLGYWFLIKREQLFLANLNWTNQFMNFSKETQ
jgi:hypothetical protein